MWHCPGIVSSLSSLVRTAMLAVFFYTAFVFILRQSSPELTGRNKRNVEGPKLSSSSPLQEKRSKSNKDGIKMETGISLVLETRVGW